MKPEHTMSIQSGNALYATMYFAIHAAAAPMLTKAESTSLILWIARNVVIIFTNSRHYAAEQEV